MSATSTRSRWLEWQPAAQIGSKLPGTESTKPSNPGSVGFEGPILGQIQKIEVGPDPAELAKASRILHHAGVRFVAVGADPAAGVWADLDGPDVRAALQALGMGGLRVAYLDGPGIPARYKVRRVDGEPVPLSVLVEMEREPAEPWKVRDRMLSELGWQTKGRKAAGGALVLSCNRTVT